MKEGKGYPLIALQLNISPGSARNGQPRPASKTSSKFIIKEFFKQTVPALLPPPAFVALHDGVSTMDCENIQNAFLQRPGSVVKLTILSDVEKKDVRLLYNPDVLTNLTVDDNLLVQDDFFKRQDNDNTTRHHWTTKSMQLFKRIAGGLFQHIKSSQFIVGISYHGINNSFSDPGKKEFINGIHTIFAY
jgi:hypothetical protein